MIENPTVNSISNPQTWVNLYSNYLFKFAMMRLRNREVAEDMVQETFLSALKAINNFEGKSTEKTWLTSILKNKILDYWKKSSTKNETLVNKVSDDDSFYNHFFEIEERKGHWTENNSPQMWQSQGENKLEQKEFYKILESCMAKLNDKQGAVFKLKFIEDLESNFICKELDLTSSNYWVLMHRAKLLIRECIEKNWFLSSKK